MTGNASTTARPRHNALAEVIYVTCIAGIDLGFASVLGIPKDIAEAGASVIVAVICSFVAFVGSLAYFVRALAYDQSGRHATISLSVRYVLRVCAAHMIAGTTCFTFLVLANGPGSLVQAIVIIPFAAFNFGRLLGHYAIAEIAIVYLCTNAWLRIWPHDSSELF